MMKNRILKNTLLLGAMLVMSIALYAVPARRSFHDCVLTDGTTVSLTLSTVRKPMEPLNVPIQRAPR